MLDKAHSDLALLQREPSFAALALIALYDTGMVADKAFYSNFAANAEDVGTVIPERHNEDEGFSQGLRWIGSGKRLEDQVTLSRTDLVEAKQLLSHASDYVHIADYHKLFSRGICRISVSEHPPTVRFFATRFGDAGMREDVLREKHSCLRVSNFNLAPLRRLRAQSRQLTFRGNCFLQLAEPSQLLSPDIINACRESFRSSDLHELSEHTSVMGIPLEHFDLVKVAMNIWSFCLIWGWMDILNSCRPTEVLVPTQLISLSQLTALLAQATGLTASNIQAVVEVMTLDWNTKAPDVLLTPFVPIGDRLVWSPRRCIQHRFRRNALKVIARRSKTGSDAVANVMDLLEKPMVDRFAAKLRRYGFTVSTFCRMKTSAFKVEADLVATHPSDIHTLLFVEAKACLPPDEISEIDALTDQCKYAATQVDACIAALADERWTALLASRLGLKSPPRRGHGLVVTYEGTPNTDYDRNDVPVLELFVFLNQMRSRDFRSVARLWEAGKSREWLKDPPELREWIPIQVGSVRYEMPAATIKL